MTHNFEIWESELTRVGGCGRGTIPNAVLHDYLELAADVFAVELEGRLIFAF